MHWRLLPLCSRSLLVQGDSSANHRFFFALLVKYKEVIHLKRFIDPFIVYSANNDCIVFSSRVITHVHASPGNCSVPLILCPNAASMGVFICMEQQIFFMFTS